MIADLNPYPAMKDSGVKWLGEVPEHWQVRRLRNVAGMRVSNVDKHVKEGETPVRLCNYVDVYRNDRISQRINFMRATATPEEIARFRLEEGDVLITKDSEAWDDIGVPALVTEPADDLISGYHLAMLRPFADELAGSYLLRVLQSKGSAYHFHVEAKGVTRYGLSHAGIKSIWLPLPALPEQTAIVRYLDHVDRRVRRLVRAKHKLIALLTEQKQAIIHRAVTRGLDPDVPMKDSGVEWLGEVPAHWEVRRLKFLVRQSGDGIQMGPFGASLTDLQSQETGFKLFGQENTISGDFKKGRRWLTQYQFESLRRYELVAGDLVLTRKGSLGNCKMVPPEAPQGIADSDTIRVRLNLGESSPEYIVLLLQDAPYVQKQIESTRRGAVLGGLNTTTIANLKIATPPLPEQRSLLVGIRDRTQIVTSAITRAEREIELLEEYRTRLIADVVTGKLDVREAAAGLPEVDPLADDEPDALEANTEMEPADLDATPEEAEA